MFQNEITLLLGVGVAGFIFLNWALLRRLPRFPLLLAAYFFLVSAWATANAEALLWPDAFRLISHLCTLGSSVLMALWCWSALRLQRGARP